LLAFLLDFFDDFLDDFFRAGTLAPSARASDKPIAMACLRLVTFLPERPERSLPLFISSMLRWTFFPALPVRLELFFLPVLFFRVAMARGLSNTRAKGISRPWIAKRSGRRALAAHRLLAPAMSRWLDVSVEIECDPSLGDRDAQQIRT
jgi:hypothetical protein